MKDLWVKWFAGDFLHGVSDLEASEGWVYVIVLNLIYDKGGPVPYDVARLARRCRLKPKAIEAAVDTLVQYGKLTVRDGMLSNGKAEKMLKSRRSESETRAEAGRAGGVASGESRNKNKDGTEAIDKPDDSKGEPFYILEARSQKKDKDANASSAGSALPMPTDLGLVEPLKPEAKPEVWSRDADFAATWASSTEQGRKRSSRAKAWPEWRKALKAAPGPVLAAAMARYVAGDEDAKRTGGPGLHLWLKDGRFEHWLTAGTSGAAQAPVAFNGPPALRTGVVALLGEPFARSWIDSCTWDGKARTLIARNAFGLGKLNDELGSWMRQMKVRATTASEHAKEPV